MDSVVVALPATVEPAMRLRMISRLTTGFVLDVVSYTRGNGHILDTLLLSAIIQANIADVDRDTDLQARLLKDDAPPTDEMRRPVSMNALANSLELPFETVRRRITKLIQDGYVAQADGGVIVPTSVLTQPEYYDGAFRGYERLRVFYYQLRDYGLLEELPPPTAALGDGVFPIRAISRLVGAFVLRMVEILGLAGHLVDGLVMLEVFRSNTEHLPTDPRLEKGPHVVGGVKDDSRRPISVTAVAQRLGLPQETVRRHAKSLVERGVCARIDGGLIVPARTLGNRHMQSALAGNANNLQRLFAALSRMGVLEVWDSVEGT